MYIIVEEEKVTLQLVQGVPVVLRPIASLNRCPNPSIYATISKPAALRTVATAGLEIIAYCYVLLV